MTLRIKKEAACRRLFLRRAAEDLTILEGVPYREFDHAAVNREQRLTRGVAVLVGLREVSAVVGEPQLHIGVVNSVELRQGVVQEVEGFKTQLNFLPLPDGEVLVDR